MRIDVVKDYIQRSRGLTKDELLEKLAKDTFLDKIEKNAVFLWWFPFLLGDRELPLRIQEVRMSDEVMIPSDEEIVVLIGAFHSAQYGNFIRHLLHAFTDPTKVFPYSGDQVNECSICGKELTKAGEGPKETLAYGSMESSIHLCLKCLLNLQALHAALMILDGEDYLNRYKRQG